MYNETHRESVGYRLGTEELLYILEVLGLKTLPSLGADFLASVSPEQKQQILSAGFNSLRARGWVKLTGDSQHPIGLDNLFVATLLGCAQAQKLVMITKQAQNQPTAQVFIYQTLNVLIAHRQPEPGVHELIVTSAYEKLLTGLIEFLEIDAVPLVTKKSTFSLPANLTKQFMAAISEHNLSSAREIVTTIDRTQSDNQEFLDCLEKIKQVIITMEVEFPEALQSFDQVAGRVVSILSSATCAWRIEADENSDLCFSKIDQTEPSRLFQKWFHTA